MLKKKIWGIFLLFLSLVLTYFFFSNPTTFKSLSTLQADKPFSGATEIVQNSKISIKHASVDESQMMQFKDVENNWLEVARIKLNSEEYQVYQQLRNSYENDRNREASSIQNTVRSQVGDRFSYQISDAQLLSEKKLKGHYLQLLRERIGEKKFGELQRAQENFNQGLLENASEAMQIDF